MALGFVFIFWAGNAQAQQYCSGGNLVQDQQVCSTNWYCAWVPEYYCEVSKDGEYVCFYGGYCYWYEETQCSTSMQVVKSGASECSPISISFTANDSANPAVYQNQNVTLSWNAANATNCRTEGQLGNTAIATSGSYSVPIGVTSPGNYIQTIYCSNQQYSNISKSVTVTVLALPLPSFGFFRTSVQTAYQNTTFNISWNVSDATSCNLSIPPFGAVNIPVSPGSNSYPVAVGSTPAGLYTLTITCYNATGGSSVQTVSINVAGAPTITSFTAAGGGQGPASSITVPVGTAVTLNWASSGAASCSSYGALGGTPSAPLSIPVSGSVGPFAVTTPGGPFTQTLTCSNAGGSSSPANVNVTVTAPPAQPALSISPVKTSYTTDETAAISWTQPAGTTYYYILMGGVTATFAGCTSGYGCQTSLTGISGRIGDAFTVGTGRFIEVRAYNASGYSAASNRITFNVTSPAQTVTYTIKQTPVPGAGQPTVFPMAISLIDPPSVNITVPNQTSAQLTLWYSPDGVVPQAAVTSGVSWISNNPDIAVNSSGLVTTSLRDGGGDCVPGTANCVFFPNAVLGRAAISALYRDKIAIGEVVVWGSMYRFVPPEGEGGNQ